MIEPEMMRCECPRGHGSLFRRRPFILLCCVLSLAILSACEAAQQPAYFEVLELSGTPYQRGYQHGQRFADKIRSLYTMLLTNSIFPYLNREMPDVASVMLRYQDEEKYGNGKFAYAMMLESAKELIKYIPQEYIEEMQGIAAGANLPFDQILVLNTFFDTLMGFRSITFYIKLMQGPELLNVEFLGGLDADGQDNDGDGAVDEPDEGLEDPYEPKPYATMVEVPVNAQLRFIIDDNNYGVDPQSIRIQLDEQLYTAGHPSIETKPYAREGKTIEVIFTPPEGLPPASVVSVLLQSYDFTDRERTKPYHPRCMRDERIVFTTQGYGQSPWQVANHGPSDGRTQPPAWGFAVEGPATRDDNVMLVHNFALLDSDIAHKHATLFIQFPNAGRPYAYVGYTGLVWGFSGMNGHGLSYLFNTSDTLNSPFTKGFNEGLIFGEFKPQGVPVGIMGREMLGHAENTESAVAYLSQTPVAFGWNFLLADSGGRLAAVEMDSDILNRADGGFYTYNNDPTDPENLDAWGQPLASVGGHDLYLASHYLKNLNEIDYEMIVFNIRPQRYWSSFYFRSLNAFFNLGRQLRARYGRLDLHAAVEILRRKELTDQRESMNSVIYQPELLKLHVAAGEVPAPEGPFKEYDLGAAMHDRGGQ